VLVLEAIAALLAFIFGLFVLIYCSDKAVKHSVTIASAWKIPPILIGLVFVSIGTDLPEIINSIIASWTGHGDINVGDSLGSAFTQITLILGLLALLVKDFKVDKKEILIIGVCEILSLILVASVVEKGYISRTNGFFLVISWILLMLIVRTLTKKDDVYEKKGEKKIHHFIIAILGFLGVAAGSYILVESIITISTLFGVSEYFISFFIAAIGTSLPELAVDLNALRKRQYEIAIGDIIGSSIVDATLSIGIGPMIFSNVLSSGETAFLTAIYAVFASLIVIATLYIRGKVERKTGILFIIVYLVSYVIFLHA